MKKTKMGKAKSISVMLAVGLAALTALTGCNKGPSAPDGFTGTVLSFYATYVNQYAKSAYNELIDTYNNGQGKEDNVYVVMTPNPAGVNNLRSFLTGNSSRYDILCVNDMQFKGLAMESWKGNNGVFVPLDDYLTDEVKEDMAWDQISDSQINIWRFNSEKSAADSDIGQKYLAGEGAELLAMPFNSAVQVLFYNTEIFAGMGLNIVSVSEEECGTDSYAKLLPHGYAEYAESYGAPIEGAQLSQNDLGESVYKVFNNRIPMNWEELRCLARSFQNQPGNSGKYGYMSEWWFNYGWSVGGDCIGWNSETKKYDFSIGDKDKNYLALNEISVNGTQYSQGEVLDYEDMKRLRGNASEYNTVKDDLYELPSMYEAFLEFNRLGIPTDKVAATDAGETGNETVNGYGVAPNTTTNRSLRFTSGDSPMLCETSDNVNSFNQSAISGKFDMAPLAQYREYTDGSTREVNGKEYLKVIGNDWTGELQTVQNSNGEKVACCGEAISALTDDSSALAIPKNIDPEKYDDAFKFISWACGPEGQKILAKGNTCVPNQANLGMSAQYNNGSDRVVGNQWASSFALHNSYVGDWSYFNIDTWITGWSTVLNKQVREGSMTLTKFLTDYTVTATNAISTMQIRIKGK